MALTRTDVARMRLISQRLVAPADSVVQAAQHATCTQGQDYPGSTTSLALRTRDRSVAAVRSAYDEGLIVRSWPMRGTLFVVAAQDLGWMLALTADKIQRETRRRREQLALTQADLDRAEALARERLTGAGATRTELLAAWTEAGHDVGRGRGYHTIFALALAGVLCLGPTSDSEQRFVLTEEWVPHSPRVGREEAIVQWLRRYVASHGPVPLSDFLWWTKLLKRDIAPAVETLRGELATLEVDGRELWMNPDLPDRYADLRRATTLPMLLPGFDELVLGYGDRDLTIDPAHAEAIVPGGNGVFRATVIHHGRVVGTWKRPTRTGAAVSATPLTGELPGPVQRRLPALTAALPGGPRRR